MQYRPSLSSQMSGCDPPVDVLGCLADPSNLAIRRPVRLPCDPAVGVLPGGVEALLVEGTKEGHELICTKGFYELFSVFPDKKVEIRNPD